MKKIAVLLLTLTLVMLPLSSFAFAAELADGTYEVPVILMHKEDEEESFGNRYVAPTALLEVKNGKKTVTILLTTDMKGIAFSYYLDGSLEGDVAEGTPVSDVSVAGETYQQGFEIPVMADGDIGLKFSVPVMPMSPSARLRIDYASAKLVRTAEPATSETTTAKEVTTASTVAEEKVTTSASVTTSAVPVTEAAATAAPVVTEAAISAPQTQEETTAQKDSASISDMVMMIAVIAAACTLAVLITHENKEVTDYDD